MNCLILDDEAPGRFMVQHHVQKYFPEIIGIHLASSIEEALDIINQHTIDLAFLDIQLKGETGFDFLELLPDVTFEVIFVTAYDEYALKAIQQNALYYLLKPLQVSEFKKGVERAIQKIKKENTPVERECIFIHGENVIERVLFDDILFIQSSGSYTTFYLENKEVLSSKNIGFHEQQLPPHQFIRTHHSFIVNLRKVSLINKGRNGELILSNQQVIPISQRRISFVMEKLNQR